MAEERETRRRKRASTEPAQAANNQNLKAGEMLKQARLAKGLELEQISSAIHVRVGQLKAIEENHLDALPGMTYALGFVKSYATHLKLDPAEVVTKFKAENGAAAAKPPLQNHEPIAHSKMPDPFVLGACGVGFLVILVLWAIFSDGDDAAREIASNIPPAPVIAEAPPVAQPSVVPPVETAGGDPAAPAPIPTGLLMNPVTPVQVATPADGAAATAPDTAVTADGTAMTAAGMPRPKPAAPALEEAEQQQPPAEEINVKSSRGRVALKATQASWVQITDGGNIVFKKVLQPGEVYYVPEGAGYSLVTSNAGGIDVYVDGGKVRTLGKQGDIVRGVRLKPDALKRSPSRKKNAFQE